MDWQTAVIVILVLSMINSFILVANLMVANSTLKMYTEFFKELAQQRRKQ